MRLLRIPASLLRRFVGCPEEVVGIRVDGGTGSGRIASRFVRALCRNANEMTSVLAAVPHVERAALELLACAYAQHRNQSSSGSSLSTLHRIRIVEIIEAALEDPTLTPSSVAVALRITPRYLHRIFTQHGETISRYILRRRLERCAEQLKDPLHDRRHVSDIAFSEGFSTASHFCRTFRDQYGLSPGDFRARRGIGAAQ